MGKKDYFLVNEKQLFLEKNELISLLNSGDLESIKLGDTVLDEEKLIALLALLEDDELENEES